MKTTVGRRAIRPPVPFLSTGIPKIGIRSNGACAGWPKATGTARLATNIAILMGTCVFIAYTYIAFLDLNAEAGAIRGSAPGFSES
jgi:hypothetical protein